MRSNGNTVLSLSVVTLSKVEGGNGYHDWRNYSENPGRDPFLRLRSGQARQRKFLRMTTKRCLVMLCNAKHLASKILQRSFESRGETNRRGVLNFR